LSGLHGNFNTTDRAMPWFRLVQNVGDVVAKNPEQRGNFAWGPDPLFLKSPVTIVYWGAHKRYRQNLRFDRDNFPLEFGSAEEVIKNGGNVEPYVKAGNDDMNFQPFLKCIVAVKAPRNGAKKAPQIDGSFEFGGDTWLPAVCSHQGTGYRAVVGKLLDAENAMKRLGKDLRSAQFSLASTLTEIGGNHVYLPVLQRLPEPVASEFVQLLAGEVFPE
jgi:hypothetical protein